MIIRIDIGIGSDVVLALRQRAGQLHGLSHTDATSINEANRLGQMACRIDALADLIDRHLNRDAVPCDENDCKHSYDNRPAGSVTEGDMQLDQCATCGWTARDAITYRTELDRSIGESDR